MRLRHVIALLCLTACAEGADEIKRPADVLPQDKMVALLDSAHILEARLQVRRVDTRAAKDTFDMQFAQAAKALGTDTATFARSYVWYARHVPEMDKLYEAIIDSLGIEESRTRPDSAKLKATKAPAAQTAPAPDSAGKKSIPGGINRLIDAQRGR